MTLLIVVAVVAGYLFLGVFTARALAAYGQVDIKEDGEVASCVMIWPIIALMAAAVLFSRVIASVVRAGDDR